MLGYQCRRFTLFRLRRYDRFASDFQRARRIGDKRLVSFS